MVKEQEMKARESLINHWNEKLYNSQQNYFDKLEKNNKHLQDKQTKI